ncbi:MAG TPA: YceI family protein [Solirubrobacteraceae bacterium]
MSDPRPIADPIEMAALPDGIWSVEERRSELGFAVKAIWGLQTVRGVFGAYEGSLRVEPGRATGELTIDAASLDTRHKRRDRHLSSPDFFDVERSPRIVFTATSVAFTDRAAVVNGELAIGSSRLALEIPVTVEETTEQAVLVVGTTTISRKAVGLSWNWLGTISDDVVLHARLTLRRRGSGAR